MEQIKQAHLLLAMFNALQPGVFALSGWDLCGMLTWTVSRSVGSSRMAIRWIHRAAYDHGLPASCSRVVVQDAPWRQPLRLAARQLQDSSFARRLGEILAVRKRYGIAASIQLDVPHVSNKAMLVMVHQLTDAEQVTVLNFCACHRRKRQFRSPGARQRVGRHVH